MLGTGVIDRFLEVFTRYIDSGFGLLQGEVAWLPDDKHDPADLHAIAAASPTPERSLFSCRAYRLQSASDANLVGVELCRRNLGPSKSG